ncbi:transcriptional regulator, ArsR family [Thermoplasmatales archaeon BRNA1]|nr:transcriptional regulator, ArsR family [Thermoplasmatales archaeon BRNA1]
MGEHEPTSIDMPTDECVMDLADFFSIFSDSTRIRILWVLYGRELCVRDISDTLGISMSACSHQLKTLRNSGAVEARRDGKMIYYKLADEHVEILLRTGLEHIQEE